jgi:hypothetical protein
VSFAPLITLASVQEWLATGGTGDPYPSGDSALLGRLIGAVSSFAVTYLSRPIVPATFSEVYNGRGTSWITLRQQPIISVASLVVGTTSIAARTTVGQFGYAFTDSSIAIDESTSAFAYGGSCQGYGPGFYRGIQNVAVTYDAGYQTSDAVAVPYVSPFSIDTGDLSRPWNADRGVAYANSTALARVTGAPSLGQYQVTGDPPHSASQYAFAAADMGAALTITYGFTPEDIAQALIELVGERFKARSRIGEVSRGLQQQPATFSQKDMNASVKALLANWKNVVPIP